jgi:hypothetical protein
MLEIAREHEISVIRTRLQSLRLRLTTTSDCVTLRLQLFSALLSKRLIVA